MGWIRYPGDTTGTNAPNVPQSVQAQQQASQMLMQGATSTAPYSSGGITALKAVSGALGGYEQGQADQAMQLQQAQQAGQSATTPSLMARLLSGGQTSAPTQLPGAALADGSDPGQSSSGFMAKLGSKSDRRLKSDVSRVGTLPNGLAVYRYRLEGGPFVLGLMADEVMALHPDAVWADPEDGFLRVDYSMAML